MNTVETNDAKRPPDPHGGWSTKILTVADAIVVPPTGIEMIQSCGVFDAKGRYVDEAVLWRGRPLMVEPEPPADVEHLSGRWIWGGVLLNHFGHFLTESTGRLWALDALEGAIDGIVFISKRDTADEKGALDMQPYHRVFFDLLGIDVPIRILTRPTRIDSLEVPGQGFGIGQIASGTAPFRAFIHNRFAKDIAPDGPENLYVSRSELGAVRGGILEEKRVEKSLESCGYAIFHPQKHALTEQLARYKAARKIISLDGSALHLLAMVGNADQKLAMVKRRDSPASESIVRHLAAFMGTPPVVVDVILQDWVRSDRKRADRHSIGELDFAALGKVLAAEGFIPDEAVIAGLTADETLAAVRDVEKKLSRGKLTFQPISRSGTASVEMPKPKRKDAGETIPPRRAARMARRASEAQR
jgi:hypothetical protein